MPDTQTGNDAPLNGCEALAHPQPGAEQPPLPKRQPPAVFISRALFAERHFPQLACFGEPPKQGKPSGRVCRYYDDCTALLAMPKLEQEFWLVRGPDNICARDFFSAEPIDIRLLRTREMKKLNEIKASKGIVF